MIKSKLPALAVATLAVSGAQAQVINSCDHVASAENLVEPWGENTRTFANGNIRVALLNTGGEPACCANHMLVLSPDPDYGMACHVLSAYQGDGYREIRVSDISAKYILGRGLNLFVPVGEFDPDTGEVDPRSRHVVDVLINQATGEVSVPNVLKKVVN